MILIAFWSQCGIASTNTLAFIATLNPSQAVKLRPDCENFSLSCEEVHPKQSNPMRERGAAALATTARGASTIERGVPGRTTTPYKLARFSAFARGLPGLSLRPPCAHHLLQDGLEDIGGHAEFSPERVIHRRGQEDQQRDEDRQDRDEDGVELEVFDPEQIGQAGR